jgi:pimeloyl-ACP methyl ester carboxylesterase
VDRAVIAGFSEGGTMAAFFAATYPERTEGLILSGTFASWRAATTILGRQPCGSSCNGSGPFH